MAAWETSVVRRVRRLLRPVVAVRLRETPALLGLLVMFVGILLGPTGLFLWRYDTWSLLQPGVIVLFGAGGAVLASRVGYRSAAFRVVSVVGALGGCGVGLIYVVPAVRDGLVAPAVTTTVAGALLAVAGAGLLAVEPVLPSIRVGTVLRWDVLATTVVGVVVLVVAVTGWVRAPRTSVSAVALTDLPTVTRPGLVGWRWVAGARVGLVLPIRGGVVFDRDTEEGDETVALDGATGAVRWTFVHPGVALSSQYVSSDGGTVVIKQSIPEGNRSAGRQDLVSVIDVATGAVRAEFPVEGSAPLVAITEDVVVVREQPTALFPETLVAHDLDDGSDRWDWSPTTAGDIGGGTCLGMSATDEIPLDLSLPDTVPAWSDCEPLDGSRGLERRIVGLDARTGVERWRFGPVPVTTTPPPTVGVVPGFDVIGIRDLYPTFLDGHSGVPVVAPPVPWPPREYDSTAGIAAPGAFVTVERPVVGGSTVIGTRG